MPCPSDYCLVRLFCSDLRLKVHVGWNAQRTFPPFDARVGYLTWPLTSRRAPFRRRQQARTQFEPSYLFHGHA